MPNYGVKQSGGVLTEIQPGDQFVLFNAESPTPPQASVAFNTGYQPGGQSPQIAFTIDFATAPSASEVHIQGANINADADFQDLYVSTNVQHDLYLDNGKLAFYRAKLVGNTGGGALTVIAQR